MSVPSLKHSHLLLLYDLNLIYKILFNYDELEYNLDTKVKSIYEPKVQNILYEINNKCKYKICYSMEKFL